MKYTFSLLSILICFFLPTRIYSQSILGAGFNVCKGQTYEYFFSATFNGWIDLSLHNGKFSDGSTSKSFYHTQYMNDIFEVIWNIGSNDGTQGIISASFSYYNASNEYISGYTSKTVKLYGSILCKINPEVAQITPGQSITLSSLYSAGSYKWMNNNNVIGTGSSISVSPTVNSTYELETSYYFYLPEGELKCTKSDSRVVTIVSNPIVNNFVSSNQVICSGVPSNQLIQKSGTSLSGGNGIFTYQWQKSTDEGSTWVNIAGATLSGYSPGVITQNTFFRRIVFSGIAQSTSNVVSIKLAPESLIISENISSASGELSYKAKKYILINNVSTILPTVSFEIDNCSGGSRTSEFSEDLLYYDSNIDVEPFPNPISSGRLNFGKVIEQYSLFNSSGNLVRSGDFIDGFDVDGLNKGIYLLKLNNESKKILIH